VIWTGWRQHRGEAFALLGVTIACSATPSHRSSYGCGACA
jgi:hypothetical protein